MAATGRACPACSGRPGMIATERDGSACPGRPGMVATSEGFRATSGTGPLARRDHQVSRPGARRSHPRTGAAVRLREPGRSTTLPRWLI